jgi:hypothetical protein
MANGQSLCGPDHAVRLPSDSGETLYLSQEKHIIRGSRPNGRVPTARFFWSVHFWYF